MSAVGHSARDILKDDTTQSVAASATDQVVSISRFNLSHEDSLHLRIDAVVANTAGGTPVMKLQTAYTKDGPWFDSKTINLANGNIELKITEADSSDATYLPLRSNARVVVSTGAGVSCDITALKKSERR